MIRDILNALSTPQILLIFGGGGIVAAIAMTFVIRKLAPNIAESRFEEVASGLRVVYELLFALILAFVVASVIDKLSDAEDVVDKEATSLSLMLRANLAFPADVERRLNAGMQAYIGTLVDDEWETMRHGEPSGEARAALDSLYGLYEEYAPAAGIPDKFYDEAIANLAAVAAARRERLGLAAAGLPPLLLLMLPIGAILLLVLEYRPRLPPRSQAAFMGALALVLSSTYLLTILLDYPFSGDLSVGNESLRTGALDYFGDTIKPREAQDDDTRLEITPPALEGIWATEGRGTTVLRRVGGELRGAYRLGDGTVRGKIDPDGVFRGVWCEGSRDVARRDAGLVEWRLVRTRAGERIVTGIWGTGFTRRRDGTFGPTIQWDLRRLKLDQAQDLVRRLDRDPDSMYCKAPGQ